MTTGPAIRGGISKALLDEAARLPEAPRARVFEALSDEVRDALAPPFAISWVPMSAHMALADAAREAVGPEENLRLWRRAMAGALELPLLRGFVQLSRSLLDVTPASLLQRTDRLYEHLSRQLGEVETAVDGERAVKLSLTGFPSRRFRFATYVEGLTGCTLAVLDLVVTDATVQVLSWDDATGTAHYRASWGAAAGPP